MNVCLGKAKHLELFYVYRIKVYILNNETIESFHSYFVAVSVHGQLLCHSSYITYCILFLFIHLMHNHCITANVKPHESVCTFKRRQFPSMYNKLMLAYY